MAISAFAIQSRSGDQVNLSFLDSDHNQPDLEVTVNGYDAFSLLDTTVTLAAAFSGGPGKWLGVAGPFNCPNTDSYFGFVHKPGATKPLATISF